MNKTYKTFRDLVFKDWMSRQPDVSPIMAQYFRGHKQAWMDFPNGYSISVLLGRNFYSNGVNTYEVAIFDKDGGLCCPLKLMPDDDVAGYRTQEEVSEIMREIQDL